jgi:hypothetical protein
MANPSERPITKEALAELAHQLSLPVDCERLIRDGVLARRRGWFELLQPERLPEHANRQIIEVKSTGGRTLIRFTRSHARAKVLHKKLSG